MPNAEVWFRVHYPWPHEAGSSWKEYLVRRAGDGRTEVFVSQGVANAVARSLDLLDDQELELAKHSRLVKAEFVEDEPDAPGARVMTASLGGRVFFGVDKKGDLLTELCADEKDAQDALPPTGGWAPEI